MYLVQIGFEVYMTQLLQKKQYVADLISHPSSLPNMFKHTDSDSLRIDA